MKAKTMAIRTYTAMLVLIVFLLGVYVFGYELTEQFVDLLK